MAAAFVVHAGERARRHVTTNGLAPGHIACIPAAAGGPKGLALLPFDRRLAAEWLPHMRNVELAGASIGAWRMAALAQRDATAALERLQHAYVREQNYDRKPTPAQVSAVCRGVAGSVAADGAGAALSLRDGVALTVISARARGPLNGNTRSGFARAALDNLIARTRLARHLQRVVFRAGAPGRIAADDAFDTLQAALTPANQEDALLASGSIPLICDPVRGIGDAPPGEYWDGGLIDYHLLLPYAALPGVVLYPHFVPWVTPGWLDKSLPWRARPHGHAWLANVIVIAPSAAMLARLPNGKLPDRDDFYRYGQDHAARIRDWERAIAEMQRYADEALAWMTAPDPAMVQPL